MSLPASCGRELVVKQYFDAITAEGHLGYGSTIFAGLDAKNVAQTQI